MMYGGIYRGVVVNSNDPEKLGRLVAKVPVVLGDATTEWAWPCVPPGWFTGFTSGSDPQGGGVNSMPTASVPHPGSPVWVMFEAGDVTKPVWMGIWRTRG